MAKNNVNKIKDYVRPYTEIGGPYNEARVNKKHIEAQKRRERRAKMKEEKENNGQEM